MGLKIRNKAIRIVIIFSIVFLLLFILVGVLYFINKPQKSSSSSSKKNVEPSYAPADYEYTEKKTKSGYKYSLTPDGKFFISKNGSKYMLTSDGTVYTVNSDGSYEEVNDPSLAKSLRTEAKGITNTDGDVSSYFDSTFDTLSNTDISASERVLDLFNKGMSLDDILSKFGEDSEEGKIIEELIRAGKAEGKSAEELLENITKSGTTLSSFMDAWDTKKEALENLASENGIPFDAFLDALEEVGMTGDEFLSAYNTVEESITPTPTQVVDTPAPIQGKMASTSAIGISLSNPNTKNKDSSPSQNTISQSYYPTATDLASIAGSMTATKTESTYEGVNDQDGKISFSKEFEAPSTADQLTVYDIAPGTIVSMTLKTGINTDLPGQVVAEVNENVYDSLNGKNLLIPKGTRLLASYSSNVSFGQKRVLVAWTQLIRPDGYMLSLPGFSGTDGQGFAGYNEKVDNHIWELLGFSALSTLLDIGTGEVTNLIKDTGLDDIVTTGAGAYVTSVQSLGQKYLENAINRQPTLMINPGKTIKMLVNTKLTFPPYK